MSKWLRGLNSHLMGKKTALLFINHAKPEVGGFGHTLVKPCGKSIDFHSMVQLQVTGGDSSIHGTKKDFNAKCIKTRYGIVGKQAKIKIDLDPYKPIIEVK